MSHCVGTVALDDLREGANILNGLNIIVWREGDKILATWNRCKHSGGKFKQKDSVLVCTRHGWILDPKRMEYVNPAGNIVQPRLETQIKGGVVSFFENHSQDIFDSIMRNCRPDLNKGEFSCKFYSHACIEVRAGKTSFFTDPWLCGPAFTNGWWLSDTPPDEWEENISKADAIYISHNHSDHLNIHTLRRIVSRCRDTLILVPEFESTSCFERVVGIGFRNVQRVPFNTWKVIGELRIMMLRDAAHRDDSGILIDYRGYSILNTVDCANLNGGMLPKNIDLLCTSYASGASGYPVCWGELYGEKRVKEILERNRRMAISHVFDLVKKTEPRAYMPFAGYFVEGNPQDLEIKELNVKNDPGMVCSKVSAIQPNVVGWIPVSGDLFDIGLCKLLESKNSKTPSHYEPWLANQVHEYSHLYETGPHIEYFSSLKKIQDYFVSAGYQGNLVLELIETDSSFEEVVRQYIWDFEVGKLVERRPSRTHAYLRIKVRSSAFRYVLYYGLPWEELSIGFQMRFYREPDIYNMDFWSHFQNVKLPLVSNEI